MTYKEIVNTVAEELGLPLELVQKTYSSYWQAIREKVQTLPLKEDMTEEEFKALRTNFNIPSLGKLSCTYPRYVSVKRRFKNIKQLRNAKDKED